MMLVGACGGGAMPDPRDAARAYARAARAGDAAALHAMMTSEAQRAYGPEGVKKVVSEARTELASRGQALATGPLRAESRAQLTYEDGEAAVLDLDSGRFFVSSAGTLPAGAATPSQALAELRRALASRSYPALVRVLAKGSATDLEETFSSLVEALEQPETLDVPVTGDRAVVELPEGHTVTLRREDGVWRVEDFR